MNFIKKIYDDKIDESVHLQFQKFSPGEYNYKAMIDAKQSKGKYTISTTTEFANELVRAVAEKLGSEKTNVTGAIVTTADLTGELDYQDKKQFQGVKRYIIDAEMSGDEIIALLDKLPKAFFALSFTVGDTKLKIKPKAPKSGKPSKKGGGRPKADFCKLITKDANLAREFIFEKTEWAKAFIEHQFLIDDIVVPPELEAEGDFAKIRELARRKGKIIRKALIDEEEIDEEKEFEA